MIYIYYSYINEKMHDALLKKHLLNFPQQFRERISRFRRWEDAQLSLLGRLLLEKGLKEHASSYNFTQNDLLYTSYGKPYLEDNTVQFNISHSGTIVMCAISKEYEIGVDIEQIIPINVFDFKSQMITKEWESIKNQKDTTKAFYEYWTKKEAVIKADGKGLSLALKSFEIKEKTCEIKDVLFVIREILLDKKYKCYIALKIKKSLNNVSFLFNEKIIVSQICFMFRASLTTGKSGQIEPLIPDEIEQSKSSVKIDSICRLKLVFFS